MLVIVVMIQQVKINAFNPMQFAIQILSGMGYAKITTMDPIVTTTLEIAAS